MPGDRDLEYILRVKDQASRSLRSLEGNLTRLDKKFGHMEGTSKRMGRSLKGALVGLGKFISVAAVGLGAKAVTTFGAEFEKQMSLVGTLSDEAAEKIPQLSLAIRDMALQSGQELTNLAKAEFGVVSATGDVESSMILLAKATDLAIAGGTTVDITLDGLARTLNAFDKGLESSGEAADALFSGMVPGITTIQELSSVIGNVAPAAAKAGATMQETFAALGGATKVIAAPRAATSLRTFFAKIEGSTEAVRKKSREMADQAGVTGFEFSKQGIQAEGLTVFMEKLAKVTGGSTEKLGQLGLEIRSLEAANVLLASGGKKMREAMDAQGVGAGQLDKKVGLMKEGISFKMDQLGAIWAEAKVMFFEEFVGPLGEGSEGIGLDLEDVREVITRIAGGLRMAGNAAQMFVGTFTAAGVGLTAIFGEAFELIQRVGNELGLVTDAELSATRDMTKQMGEAWRESVDSFQEDRDEFMKGFDQAFGDAPKKKLEELGKGLDGVKIAVKALNNEASSNKVPTKPPGWLDPKTLREIRDAADEARDALALFQLPDDLTRAVQEQQIELEQALKDVDIGPAFWTRLMLDGDKNSPEALGLMGAQLQAAELLVRTYRTNVQRITEEHNASQLELADQEADEQLQTQAAFLTRMMRVREDAFFELEQQQRTDVDAQLAEVLRRYEGELRMAERLGVPIVEVERARAAEMGAIWDDYDRKRAESATDLRRTQQDAAIAGDDFGAGFSARIQQINDDLDTMGELGAQVADTLTHGFADRAVDAIDDYRRGLVSAGDAMKQVAEGILEDLGRLILKHMILSMVSRGLGAILPSGDGAAAVPGVPNPGGGFSQGPSGMFPAMAKGGIVRRPTMALIGEAGPEAVIPLNQLAKHGGGGDTVNVTFTANIRAMDSKDVRAALRQEAATLGGIVREQLGKDRGLRTATRNAAKGR